MATREHFLRCFTSIWQILTGQSRDGLNAQDIADVRHVAPHSSACARSSRALSVFAACLDAGGLGTDNGIAEAHAT